jgi:ketosteroid isomerase-like protein
MVNETRQTGLPAFDQARDAFRAEIAAAPLESLDYLPPGDDYALGGLVHHVNAVLEHYAGLLDRIVDGGYRETEPRDRPGLFEDANARARAGLPAGERDAVLVEMDRLHAGVASRARALEPALFVRQAPVRFDPGADPLPTSPADVLGWLTDHYREHVVHADALLRAWREHGSERETLAAVTAFNAAFGRHDVDGIMARMTADCVFENTLPPPDGARHVGQDAVRAFWTEFFAANPSARFETEETIVSGDRAIQLWVFRWDGREGPGHVRGVDVFRVRDGLVAEKLAYVKG